MRNRPKKAAGAGGPRHTPSCLFAALIIPHCVVFFSPTHVVYLIPNTEVGASSCEMPQIFALFIRCAIIAD